MWPKLFSKKRDQKRQTQAARNRRPAPASCCNQNCDQGRTCPARKSSGDTAA